MTETEGNEPEGEPVPVADTMDEQFDAFVDRYRALADEALVYGIDTVIGLCCHDRLGQQGYRAVLRRGNWFAARGLVQTMAEEIRDE